MQQNFTPERNAKETIGQTMMKFDSNAH